LLATTDPLEYLRQLFANVQRSIEEAEIGFIEGATAVISLIIGDEVYVANVGDSRAVISKGGSASRVSYDHKPDDPIEENRIRKLGGFINEDNRVNGVLALSRAFGDTALKGFVIAEPFLSSFRIGSDTEFLILACDGVWDVLSDQDAVDLVASHIHQHGPERSAGLLRDYAFMYGSMDNISALVIHFPASPAFTAWSSVS